MPKVRKTKEVNGVVLYECSKCKRLLPTALYFIKNSVKSGLTSRCRECIAEYDKERLDYRREYMRVYRDENRAAIRENQRRWEKDNPETACRYHREHKGEIKEYYKEWYSKHYKTPEAKEKYKANLTRRRTLKHNAIATLTAEEWVGCLEYFEYKDAYTGLPMDVVSKDHIIPLNQGGGYTKQNIVPCENSINKSKNSSDMETWYRKQPFFTEERLNRINHWTSTP